MTAATPLATRHWDRLGNGGLTFTELGFGTAPIGNLYRAISEDEAQAVLERAWDAGVRVFDTAPLYGLGLAETRLNRFLRGRPRDDYVLSTKVGRLLRVTGKLQREAGVVHVVAETIEDLSPLLDRLLDPGFRYDGMRAGDQP